MGECRSPQNGIDCRLFSYCLMFATLRVWIRCVSARSRRTREQLSRVAIALFADRGLHAVRVEEICERAEVSPRTFFRYFRSKEDVVFPNDAARRAIVRDALARQLPGETLSAAARHASEPCSQHDLQEDRDHRAPACATARQRQPPSHATSPPSPPTGPAS